MASGAKLSYQRLRNEEELEDQLEREVKKARAWLKFKALAGRRRPKVRVPRLKRILRKKSKSRNSFRVSWRKAVHRLKDGLFGANYLFLHCNPTMPNYHATHSIARIV